VLGFTWLDWFVVILITAFAVRGLMAGVISQAFAILGVVAGLWVAGWVSHWIEPHWRGAHPAFVFTVLRILIVLTAGLAVSAAFQWWGALLRGATKKTPAGWMDRPVGFLIGAAVGVVVAVFALLGALLVPWPRELADAAARSRMARPTMAHAARVCAAGARFFPGSNWLRQRFLVAERRAQPRRS
jgi:uncharacterized membrane protein required for colicin V production